MATTPNRHYPLPDVEHTVAEEFYVLQQQLLPALDNDIHALFQAVSGLAPKDHTHVIGDVDGLADALANKMPAGKTFAISDLTDVDGAAEAPNKYVLVKVGAQWVAQAALSALGEHTHTIAQVIGLADALTILTNSIPARTVSVDAPAGGADGDIWFQIDA